MKVTGAFIKEQGVSFAIVVVEDKVLSPMFSSSEREEIRASYECLFPAKVPILLMGGYRTPAPAYHGNKDLVSFLQNIDVRRIPFSVYTLTSHPG